ncbi:uncharacterized protein [Apostichopus japonicus]|uniref:uncharacterized protein isoform X4 n=1 Tax=Stichopus japonicus TaxID=307972 RepID=UPI003AB4947B
MLPCKIRGTDHTTTSRWKSISIMDQLRLFTCVVLLCALFVCSETKPNRRDTTCEEIRRRSTCADMGYDHTMFPNALGHESADSAEEALNVILSGLASVTGTGDQCYTLIRTFMCHSHVPMCVASSSTMLPPCREMCELLFSECGHIMQTIPQLSSLNCEMAPYSNSDITMPNCAPVSPVVEANVCCPRPFKNVGGACIKILKKARPQKSSVKSCEADGATFAKLAPRDHLIPFLQSELFDTADNMWLGISVEDGARLVWTFDGTEVAPEYLMGGGLSPDDIGSRKTCFILDAEGEIGVADCRNTDAPTLCQVSNECPFGISSTPRVVEVTPPDEGVSNGTSVTSDGEEREEDRDTPFVPLPESGECEAQTMVLCRDLGYTMTRFPNALGMPNQEDAFNELKRWAPLIGIGCSPHMKELLCSLYAPPCMSASSPAQLPCREVCESAKEGCLPQMQKFGHSWPNVINCTKFASYSGSESCYMGSLTVSDSPSGSASGTCELIEDPMCLDFGYSYTMMPNGFGQATQMEASMGMNAFQSLILLGCSPALPSFLCGMFYPVCTNGINVLPCRSLCETARSGCASFVEAIGLEWPPELDCANLQEDELCFNGTSMSEMPGESEESMTPPSGPILGSCEEISSPMCKNLPYSSTSLPNNFGHQSQDAVNAVIVQMLPLVQIECSPHLEELLCLVHFPPCGSLRSQVPCRELCEAAMSGCAPIMSEFGYEWPEYLNCEELPSFSQTTCFMGSIALFDKSNSAEASETCQPLRVPSCSHMPYSFTEIKNTTQEQIETLMQNYLPLIQLGCSSAVIDFFCTIHAPPCFFNGRPSFICREMCEAAIDGCPILQQASADQSVNCNLYASKSSGLCFYEETEMDQPSDSCEEVTVPLCQDMPYYSTSFPNMFGQVSQEDAALEVHLYEPLVQMQCSPHIKEFLCAAYVPMCGPTMRTPCRELCQSARAGCEDLMVNFGFEWPGQLACESLPSSQEDMDCYIGSLQDDSAQTSGTCQPLRVPSCSHMPYNFTEIQDTTQEQIETLMQNYLPLIQLGCSSALTNFFCSIHAPPCTITGMPFFPCREVCEAAIDGCPILQQAPADQSVDCNLFPPRSSGMCVYVETEMDQPSGAECEPLELTACQGFGYTHTAFPNYLAQQSQSEAALFANIFDSIENTGECADVFLEYACQLLAPRCVGEPMRRVPPCRQLCERTRSACASLFDSEDLSSIIDCETLDAFGSYCEDDENIGDSCEEVTVPLCQDMPYYSTSFPNMFGLVSQEHAALEVHMYTPLVKVQCSPHLKEFLCAAYVPMCSPTMRTPCRELCQSARAGCENLMVDFGFEWPGKLACESFPSSQEDMDCYIGSLQDDSAQTSETCQPLRVPSCSHMPYNYTEMQNTTQEQIETLMQNYLPLIQLGCSSALTNFFCSIHAPPCSVNGMPSFPCREMCEAAIDGCPILQQAPADQSVDCNLFPPRSSGMCVYVETEMDQPSEPIFANVTYIATQPPSLCEPVAVSMCAELGFHFTTSQQEASATEMNGEMSNIMPLVQSMCSPLLLPLTCSAYTPRCDPLTGGVEMPCREICRDVLKDCKKVLKGIGIEAPSFLSCKRYPSNEDSACVMDIAPPLEPIIAEYTRTDTSLTISVEQPEGTYGIPGRGFSGYNIIHDMGVVSQDSDGSRTDITFDLTPEQSLHHIVVTVVPFNGFGEGRATDILTKSDMSMPRPGNLQVSPQPDEDGSYQLTNTALNTFACSNAADDVMAYPEWSRNGIKVEVESVESASYHVVRYGERTTVLIVTKVDSAIYTCSLEGESEVRRLQLKLPCEGITQPFCGYESIQLPNFYGHTSESEAISDAMAFVTLIQAQCSENLFNFVCATYTPMCDAPVPVLCRELCESAMRECSEVITATNFQWPDQASCENFPSMADGNCYSGSNPEPGAEPEPEPEVYPEPEPEMTPEPETEPMPNATDSGSSNAAQPPVVLKKRRYDISEQGVSGKFQGWADVQGQGAANDYCRVLKFRKKRFYLACALAGSDDELSYTSPDIRSGDFDEGFKDTWYMKDEDGDGRDDFCRCIDGTDTPYVSCMRAGDDGFEGHYDFTPTESVTPINCQKIRVNPFLGHPQIDN